MNELEEDKWDIKKILMLVLIAGIFVFGLKTLVFDKKANTPPTQVQGESIQKTPLPSLIPKEEIRQNLQGKLNDLNREVNNINVVEIATSTPAVQRVINDFKNLQSLPQSQAKDACFKICNGL